MAATSDMTTDTAAPRAKPAVRRLPAGEGASDAPVRAVTLVVVTTLVALPIAPIVAQSLLDGPIYEASSKWTLSQFSDLFSDRAFWAAARTTLGFAAVSTVVAQAVGITLAILVGRTDLPCRRWLGAVAVWPLFVSHLVLAFGWIIAYGPAGYVTLWVAEALGVEQPWNLYTLSGLSFAAGLSMAPLTYLYCVGAARNVDGALEHAARLAGAGPFRALITVTLPLLRPAILASAILNFVFALELLVLPLLLGAPSGLDFLTTYIYARGFEASPPRHGLVGAVAVLLLVIVSILVVLQMRLVGDGRRFNTIHGKAARPRRLALGRARWPILAAVMAYEGFFVVAILAGLVLRGFTSVLTPYVPISEALTLDNFRTIFGYEQYVRSIWNTLTVAGVGAAVGTVLTVAAALVSLRSESRWRGTVQFMALYPRAVPGVLVGMGFLWAMFWVPGLSVLQNTVWILTAAFVMRHLPTAWGAIQPALLQVAPDHDRAARVAGAGWTRAMVGVVLPQIKPAMAACYIILFIHFIKEYAAAVFLYAPGSEVMGTTMLTFCVQGENGSVAALATIQVGIAFAFMWLLSLVPGVRNDE